VTKNTGARGSALFGATTAVEKYFSQIFPVLSKFSGQNEKEKCGAA